MQQVVMIVENDKDLNYILSLYIRKRGFTTISFTSIEGVSEYIKTGQPHLVFLDNQLDDGTGLEFINTLKSCSPRTIIILMTADDLQNLMDCENFDCIDGLLLKPFSPGLINEMLEKIAA